MSIHPTAIVSEGAQIGENVVIGPYAIIGENVVIGDECVIGSGSVIDGWTTLGPRNKISPHVVIGTPAQDLKFSGEKTVVEMGADNTIREFVTINRGTGHGGGITKIGSHNFLMACSHVAHDCQVGDYNIFANAATIAGHIIVEDYVTIGGLSGVHQFCQLGSYSFIGGCSAVSQDILPFALANGNHAIINGLNIIGLQRKGFSEERLNVLKKAYRFLFRAKLNKKDALQKIKEELEQTEDIQHLVRFIEKSQRGYSKGLKPKTA